MDLGLKSKNALITGGSHGIGIAIAKTLAEERCNVAIGARHRTIGAGGCRATRVWYQAGRKSLAAYLVSERSSYMTGTTVESWGGATKYI